MLSNSFKAILIYSMVFLLCANVVFARWMAVDPKHKKYPSISPYAYTMNNPIRLVDPDGQEPGDPFSTPDQAANDFGSLYNDDSIRKNREFGTALYQHSDGGQTFYSYENPTAGGPAGVIIPFPRDGRNYVADAHTHGAYDPNYNSNDFSSTDKQTQQVGYLATPDGSLKKYDPGNQATTTLNTSQPSDPNDPARKNTVSPTSNTQDNATRGTMDKVIDWVLNIFH